jgi:hypothetical protein
MERIMSFVALYTVCKAHNAKVILMQNINPPIHGPKVVRRDIPEAVINKTTDTRLVYSK